MTTIKPELPTVTRCGVIDLQVCVPEDWTDRQATRFANQVHPTGIDSDWVMKKEGEPSLGGDPERVKCEGRDGFVHIMMEC